MTGPADTGLADAGHFRVEGTSGRARAATLRLARGTVHTPCFMPVGTLGDGEIAHPRRTARGRGRSPAGQRLPPLPEAGHARARGTRRTPPVHGMGRSHPHRFGRIPGLLARPHQPDRRRGRHLPQPSGREPAPAHAGVVDGDPGRDRLRHPHGLRRVSPGEASREVARTAVERTLAWLERCRVRHEALQEENPTGAGLLFPIVQGAAWDDLRIESLEGTLAWESGRESRSADSPWARRRR